ncbi:MAG: hypothetical protein N2Z59_00510 [Alteraurantiacibacter sp.]|nr:hypothetical protein [Alteraurantiacibacter sp.]
MRIPRFANLTGGLVAVAALVATGSHVAKAQNPFERDAQRRAQAEAPVNAGLVEGPIRLAPLTYVDLVELGRAAELVLRVQVRRQSNVRGAQAADLAPGHARLLVTAQTQALLAGAGPVGESQVFLVDLPLDARARPPKLKNTVALLFARRVPGRPGQIQLIGPNAIQPALPEFEARVRQVLTQLVQPEQPPQITGVREVISVPGNLAGESETQIFLETDTGAPVSLSVLRRPGMAPSWGVSWTDIVDQSARPPQQETLQWYVLACQLPPELPSEAFLQRDPESRSRARADYALVREQLGPCSRVAG